MQDVQNLRKHETTCATIDDPDEAMHRIELALQSFINLLLSQQYIAPLHMHQMHRTDVADSTHWKRSMKRLQSNPEQYVRLWALLDKLHAGLVCGMPTSQRELFYHLKSLGIANSAQATNQSIRDAISFLRCTRRSLGIKCSSRGLLAGCATIFSSDGSCIDCSNLAESAFSIPGDFSELRRQAVLRHIATFLTHTDDSVAVTARKQSWCLLQSKVHHCCGERVRFPITRFFTSLRYRVLCSCNRQRYCHNVPL